MIKRVFCVFFTVCIIVSSVSHTEAEEFALKENEVLYTFFSLPDGEAMLITTGYDKHILINTASRKSKKELFSQLKALDVKTIDALIITANNDDTCGNAGQLIETYHITKVIAPSYLSCVQQEIEIEIWESGKVYEPSPGLMFRVVKQSNSNVMNLFILFGNNTLLFMSEANEEIEELIQKFPSRIEMLKIPEYALKNYPSGELLKHLDPHLAIIYNIQENTLHDGLLERLGDSWIDVYHLKTLGTIHIHCNPGDYELKK